MNICTNQQSVECYNKLVKIAIDARFYGLENAGLGRYAIHFIEELAKIGHDHEFTIFVTEKYRDLKPADNFSTVVVKSHHYSIKEQVELPYLIHKGGYDLVHYLHFDVPIFWPHRFVVTIHDILKHRSSSRETTTLPYYKYLIKRAGYKTVIGAAVRKSQRIITPTEFVKNDLLAEYAGLNTDKLRVSYEGMPTLNVPTSQKELIAKYKLVTPYLLYVGKCYPHKNVIGLVKALTKIPDNYTLVIANKRDAFWDRFFENPEVKAISSRIHFLDMVSDADLAGLYTNAGIFVSASLEEGFGLPPLEALSYKIRPVVSDIPTFREVMGENAIYFDPNDHQNIAVKINDVLTNPELRKVNDSEVTQLAAKYSWAKMAKEILAVYEEVLA